MSCAAEMVAAKVRRYLEIPSVVGFEGPFLDFLEAELRGLGLSAERSPRAPEKLLAVWRDSGREEVLSCHVDRHGLVATGGGEYEFAASGGRVTGTTLQLPTLGYHSNRETTSYAAIRKHDDRARPAARPVTNSG